MKNIQIAGIAVGGAAIVGLAVYLVEHKSKSGKSFLDSINPFTSSLSNEEIEQYHTQVQSYISQVMNATGGAVYQWRITLHFNDVDSAKQAIFERAIQEAGIPSEYAGNYQNYIYPNIGTLVGNVGMGGNYGMASQSTGNSAGGDYNLVHFWQNSTMSLIGQLGSLGGMFNLFGGGE